MHMTWTRSHIAYEKKDQLCQIDNLNLFPKSEDDFCSLQRDEKLSETHFSANETDFLGKTLADRNTNLLNFKRKRNDEKKK